MEAVTLGNGDPERGKEQRHMFDIIDSDGELEASMLCLRGHSF